MSEISFEFTPFIEELKDFGQKAVDYGIGLGASQIEVSLGHGFTRSLEYKNSSISGIQQQSNDRVSIRFYIGKQLGIAKSTSFSQSTIEEMVDSAFQLAKLAPEDPMFDTLPTIENSPVKIKGLYDSHLANFDPEDFIQYAQEMINGTLAEEEKAITNGKLTISTSENVVANSLGIQVGEQGTNLIAYSSTSIPVDQTNIGVGTEGYFARDINNIEKLITLGKVSAEKAKKMLNAKSGPTGTFPVLMDHRATRSSLSSLIGNGVNGFSVLNKTSYFADKLGEQLGIENLNIWDDPHVDGGFRSRMVDTEGVYTTNVNLVEKGTLYAYVTDSYTANALGVANTGSAYSIQGFVRPKITQVQIGIGTDKSSALLEDMREGIYMESGIGGMFNRGSPNISNKIDRGFFVKDGEIQYPIKNSMLGTNVFDVLKNISGISSDLLIEFGSQSPSILIEGIDIGGANDQKKKEPQRTMSSF